MITNDARRTREIKSRTAMAKAAFNKMKAFSQANLTEIQKRNWRSATFGVWLCMVLKLGLFEK
jgi:hypothetical protein